MVGREALSNSKEKDVKHSSERLIRTAGATALIAGLGFAGAASASAQEAAPDYGSSGKSIEALHEAAKWYYVPSWDELNAVSPDEVQYNRAGCAITQAFINENVCAEYGKLDPYQETLDVVAK